LLPVSEPASLEEHRTFRLITVRIGFPLPRCFFVNARHE